MLLPILATMTLVLATLALIGFGEVHVSVSRILAEIDENQEPLEKVRPRAN